MEETFINFLKEHNAYEKFIKNFESDSEYSCLDELFNDNYHSEWIYSAFLWEDTPEEPDYWADLDSLWYDIAKD